MGVQLGLQLFKMLNTRHTIINSSYLCITIFTEPIYAMEDLWLAGDDIASSGIRTLQTMNDQLERDKKRPMYIYDQYNVHEVLQSSYFNNGNILSRMLNGIH